MCFILHHPEGRVMQDETGFRAQLFHFYWRNLGPISREQMACEGADFSGKVRFQGLRL